MESYTRNVSAQEAEVERKTVSSVSSAWLRSEYQVLQSYIAKPWLKKKIKAGNESIVTFVFLRQGLAEVRQVGNTACNRLPLQHTYSPILMAAGCQISKHYCEVQVQLNVCHRPSLADAAPLSDKAACSTPSLCLLLGTELCFIQNNQPNICFAYIRYQGLTRDYWCI